MEINKSKLFILLTLSCFWSEVCNSLDLLVSQAEGSDKNGGTDSAFQTLRKHKIKFEKSSVFDVYIDDGIYFEALTFDERDCGDSQNQDWIKLQSKNNNNNVNTIITGGKQLNISSFYPCSSPYDNNKFRFIMCKIR